MTDQIVAGGHIRLRPFNTRDTYPEQNISKRSVPGRGGG